MKTKQSSICPVCVVLLPLLAGCESEKARQARQAVAVEQEVRKQAIRQQHLDKKRAVTDLEQKIANLQNVIEGRESKWREAVSARHSEWSPARREQQIGILVHKWNNSNRTSDEDTVRLMRTFAWRWYELGGIPVDLADEDYWDIARAKSANWATEDQIKELRKQIDVLDLSLKSLQRQISPKSCDNDLRRIQTDGRVSIQEMGLESGIWFRGRQGMRPTGDRRTRPRSRLHDLRAGDVHYRPRFCWDGSCIRFTHWCALACAHAIGRK